MFLSEHMLLALYASQVKCKASVEVFLRLIFQRAKVRLNNADLDGYWIEILNAKASRDFVGWKG